LVTVRRIALIGTLVVINVVVLSNVVSQFGGGFKPQSSSSSSVVSKYDTAIRDDVIAKNVTVAHEGGGGVGMVKRISDNTNIGIISDYSVGNYEINATTTTTTETNPSAVDLDFMEEATFANLMKERRNRILQTCRSGDVTVNARLMTANLFIIQDKDFLWCAVFKAASSSWMDKIVDLSGKVVPEKYQKEWPIVKAKAVTDTGANGNAMRKVMKAADERTSLIIVRHPFERIVAAFRDKLERNHGANTFYKTRYGDKMVKKFRKSAVAALGADYFKHNLGAVLPVIPESRRRESDKLPVFWEFVQYLLATNPASYDEHWRPISKHCSLCQKAIDYDYVLKVEHLKAEEAAFLRHKGWKLHQAAKEATKNENNRQNLTSSQITELYFRDISDQDIIRLHKIYSADFKLFDYSFQRGDLKVPATAASDA